jgi:cytochrome c oxidase subunit 2
MPTPRASRRIRSARPGRGLVLGMGFLALALLAVGCAPHTVTPQTTVFPKTESARQIQNLYAFIFWAATFVFFVVQGAIVYILWRYRYRPDHPLPEQVHGNTRLEIAWTVLPAVILVGVAIPTIQTMFALENPPPVQGASGAPAESLTIDVTGYQWWWKYEYPEQGIVTANELVIPTGRTINLRLTSADVIHSFWIPELMGKQDVMPAHVNGLWFTAE